MPASGSQRSSSVRATCGTRRLPGAVRMSTTRRMPALWSSSTIWSRDAVPWPKVTKAGPAVSPLVTAQPVHDQAYDGVAELVRGEAAIGAVPLGDGIHQTEDQPGGQQWVDVGPQRTVRGGPAEQIGDNPVEFAATP